MCGGPGLNRGTAASLALDCAELVCGATWLAASLSPGWKEHFLQALSVGLICARHSRFTVFLLPVAVIATRIEPFDNRQPERFHPPGSLHEHS